MSVYLKAYRALAEIFQRGAYCAEALEQVRDGEDEGKLTFLVYGVLDRYLELDALIDRCCTRPKPAARLILRMGAFLGRYSQMPVYAVTDEMVDLCRQLGKEGLCGFVNATLKAIIAQPEAWPKDPVKALSVRYSTPEWIVVKYRRQYGADAEAMLAFRPESMEHIRLREPRKTFLEWLTSAGVFYRLSELDDAVWADYGSLLAARLPPESFVKMNYGSMRVVRLAERGLLSDGKLSVRSGSQADASSAHRNKPLRILDACAAPGGKSCYLADRFPRAEVTACDLHPHRVALIRSYAARLGLSRVRAEQRDAAAFCAEWESSFDLVLADVPCSGLGTMYSKPDVKLHRKPEDIPELAALQERILGNVSRYVRPGGVLVYSTCTTLREENEDVVYRFVRDHPNFGKEAEEKLNPITAHCEGFYLVRLRRES